jgi:1-acyl-sn-glycerol-3-phosphate acyltransferase
MIAARKLRLFDWWFSRVAKGRIHDRFDVLVSGLERARSVAAEGPVLFVVNHTAWWDALVILHLSRHVLGVDAYAMMDAKNLRAMPFFGLVGAFGVDLEDPRDGASSIRYAARLLDGARRVVWIFPQGRERPINERPLGFRQGSAAVARVAHRARVVPVALRYEQGERERPELLIAFGEPLVHERDLERGREAQERAVVTLLEDIDATILRGDRPGFDVLFRKEPSLMERLATRVLVALTRHRALPP